MRRSTNLEQSDLNGDSIAAKDSDTFGNDYPERPNNNSTIITFQNTGQQPYSRYSYKSSATALAFCKSHANIALYAKISLNEQKLKLNEKFNDRMKHFNQNSFSLVSSNQHYSKNAGWI